MLDVAVNTMPSQDSVYEDYTFLELLGSDKILHYPTPQACALPLSHTLAP